MRMRRKTIGVALIACILLTLAAGSVWAATINGTVRNDTLRGSPGADKIYGKGGNDRLYGAGGKDVLAGGPGRDLLVGGAGADTLRCGAGRDRVTRDVSDRVAADCEVVRGPQPAPPQPPHPPQPPPPPPPPSPGASANYTFGPEVTIGQQTAVRDALDLGARYYRSALSQEIPRFDAWAYNDLESIARVFLERSGEVVSLEQSRSLWQNTVAHAGPSGLWVGPLWFASGGANAVKILAKEEFILLLYALAGPRSLNSGLDDIPRAGPRWLSEGTAELHGYLAIASSRLTDMSLVRSDWRQRTKSSAVPLERMAILRGQSEAGSNAWGIMPLAAEQLAGDGGSGRLLSYFAAIGRGDAWETAFVGTFGKSVEAFYAEFRAYREGL
jgi:Ca2+-binding RTX toxin-like protein